VRITVFDYPRLEIKFGGKNKGRDPEIIEVADFIGVKSFRAKGKRLSTYEVSVIKELEPLIKPEPIQTDEDIDNSGNDHIEGNGQMSLEL
jgi:topoisomerase-4 subunit A